MKLKDKIAVITGGAGGFGKEFAVAFANEGARIVSADLANSDKTVAAVQAMGGEAIGVECNVASGESMQEVAARAVEAFGGIDILINNAAMLAQTHATPFTDIPDEVWDRTMAINVKGYWNSAKACVPEMRKRGKGKILNISSGTIFEGVPMLLHYVTSKAAIQGLTRSLARELGDENIYVNMITPGYVPTAGASTLAPKEQLDAIKEHLLNARIVKREQTPNDLVGGAIFLCSDDSDFISGQTINIDGGVILH